MNPLSVAVLGAGGTMGPAIARDLSRSPEAAELLLLDLDEERARAAADDAGEKARAVGVDARQGLAERLPGVDLLINAASYRVNLDAMGAALEAGCHYLDLGGLYWMTERQLALDEEWRSAGRLALLGMGASPGKTNVMAAHAVRELGEPPSRIDVVAAGRDPEPPDGFSVPYALRTLIDELTMPPVVVRGGRPQELEPLSSGGPASLPPPIGEAETVHTLHSELLTFPTSFGCREASFRLSLHPELMDRLRRLASASGEEVELAARDALPPSAHTVAAHLVEAEGASGRVVRVSAVTRPVPELGLGGGVVSTSAPAAAVARLIARGQVGATGAVPPERSVEPEDLYPELERRGCSFEVEVTEGAVA